MPDARQRLTSAATQSPRSSGSTVSRPYRTDAGPFVARRRAAACTSSRERPVARSTWSRSKFHKLFLNSWTPSHFSDKNRWSSSDSSTMTRSIPPISAASLPGRGRSHTSANRVSSVSRWSMTISFAPSLTAFLIGTAATFCSSVMLLDTTRKHFDPSRSPIEFVAARYPSIASSGGNNSGRTLDATSTLLVPITVRANFCAMYRSSFVLRSEPMTANPPPLNSDSLSATWSMASRAVVSRSSPPSRTSAFRRRCLLFTYSSPNLPFTHNWP